MIRPLRAVRRRRSLAFAGLSATAALVVPTLAQATVAFQANTNNLHTYTGGQVSTNSGNGMAAGTNPSIATLATGGTVTAFQANTGVLMIRYSNGTVVQPQLGMKAGTSPSIAAGPNGGYMVAMQSNNGELYTFSSDSGPSGASGSNNTHQGMLEGTNPSIAALPDGSYKIAFQSNLTQLVVINANGDPNSVSNPKYGLRDRTSPSIAAAPTGGYSVAFQANTGALYTYSPATGGINTNQGMMVATSPAIAYANGAYMVAFESNITQLVVINANGDPNTVKNPTFGMNTNTSPAIAPASGGGVQVAFGSNTNQLYTWTTGTSGYATLQGMNSLSSPSVTLDSPTSWWFGGSNFRIDGNEADNVIDRIRAAPSDAAAISVWNGLSDAYPSDRWAVQQTMDSKWPTSRAYGGANWKVDTDGETSAFITAFRGVPSETDALNLYNGLAGPDRNVVDARMRATLVDNTTYQVVGSRYGYHFGGGWSSFDSSGAADLLGKPWSGATRITPGTLAASPAITTGEVITLDNATSWRFGGSDHTINSVGEASAAAVAIMAEAEEVPASLMDGIRSDPELTLVLTALDISEPAGWRQSAGGTRASVSVGIFYSLGDRPHRSFDVPGDISAHAWWMVHTRGEQKVLRAKVTGKLQQKKDGDWITVATDVNLKAKPVLFRSLDAEGYPRGGSPGRNKANPRTSKCVKYAHTYEWRTTTDVDIIDADDTPNIGVRLATLDCSALGEGYGH